MNYKTIDEIYAANGVVREKFSHVVGSLSDELAGSLPDGEKWSIAQIVEHVSLVNDGTMRICSRLLTKARDAGASSSGEISISENFLKRGSEIEQMKVTAPDRVAPTNGRTIAESLAKMEETTRQLEELRPLFETHHSPEFTFSHPFFGDICAQEWLVLSGAHEARHLKQIQRILEGLETKQKDPGYEEGEITEA